MTTVHNLHREEMQEGDVYIGRAGHGQDGYFGNPFSDGSRTENIEKYEDYLRRRMVTDTEFRRRVMSLEGKRLFCFCAPLACHGDVIVKWLERNAAYVDGATRFASRLLRAETARLHLRRRP